MQLFICKNNFDLAPDNGIYGLPLLVSVPWKGKKEKWRRTHKYRQNMRFPVEVK